VEQPAQVPTDETNEIHVFQKKKELQGLLYTNIFVEKKCIIL